MFPFINWLLTHPTDSAQKYISPAFGRMLEIAVLTALSAGMAYVIDVLSRGATVDFHALVSAVLLAGLAYISKALRDAYPTMTVSLPVTHNPSDNASTQNPQA